MRVLLVATAASALVAPTQRALPKTVRHFNFGDFGKSKDYAAAQEKIRSYDTSKTVETAKYGKRAIRATQLNGQNVLNPEPACAAFIAFAAFECYLSAQACALAASRSRHRRAWLVSLSILRLRAGPCAGLGQVRRLSQSLSFVPSQDESHSKDIRSDLERAVRRPWGGSRFYCYLYRCRC